MSMLSNAPTLSFALLCLAIPTRTTDTGPRLSSNDEWLASRGKVHVDEDTTLGRERMRVGRVDTGAVIDAKPAEQPEGLRAFHRHVRSNKLGYFIDEPEMDALRPEFTSDALRRVPGVVVRPSTGIGNEVRIRGCAPLIWIDGQRTPGVELDDVTHGHDVAAIEVYRSLAGVPAEYTDRAAVCGTVVAWMRTD